MILIPAVDIKNGLVVRLFQGDFSKQTDYDSDPLKAAKRWCQMGAQWLHLVDLDGAKNGTMGNKDHIIDVTQKVDIPVEVGGGIRDGKTVEDLIKAGVKRVILGTKAIEDRPFLRNMLALYGDKICVSLDCSNGFVTHSGWVSLTNIKATDLVPELEAMGLRWLVYTDIARDGALSGPNFDQLQTILNTVKRVNVIASGGIATLEDVRKLASMKGLAAAITGKAIYEGNLDFKEAVNLLNAQ
ncbi:MAG: 1-(5-phosphoribosyl)-5-[(5-phosphoribosylamino)methylideneamino]imidazole-4-carboxamide isomerase [Candidatus Omnitrophica bacterium]|nr:1-(5-phosphoribosyl)-5-[(5-phosphoribosylamino)methylideneamino]imidazole-4-carboxamide isomerase [Candidatus Omnitrophota bacterium]